MKALEKTAWIGAALGLVVLFFVTLYIKPLEVHTTDITKDMISHEVIISGSVKSYYNKDGTIFIVLEDKFDEIDVVLFENTAKRLPVAHQLKKGDNITVQGKLDEYKGELEIIANNIEIS